MSDFDLVLKGTVVLPERIVEGGHVAVRNGKVVHVGQGLHPPRGSGMISATR